MLRHPLVDGIDQSGGLLLSDCPLNEGAAINIDSHSESIFAIEQVERGDTIRKLKKTVWASIWHSRPDNRPVGDQLIHGMSARPNPDAEIPIERLPNQLLLRATGTLGLLAQCSLSFRPEPQVCRHGEMVPQSVPAWYCREVKRKAADRPQTGVRATRCPLWGPLWGLLWGSDTPVLNRQLLKHCLKLRHREVEVFGLHHDWRCKTNCRAMGVFGQHAALQ